MNQTTTVVVALIAAAGLSAMAYTIPEQLALAWGGGFGFGGCGFGCGGCGVGICGGGFFNGCGVGFGCGGCGVGICGGGFFGYPFVFHKTIQIVSQTNDCHGSSPQAYNNDNDHKDKQVTCINTAVNTAGHGFGEDGLMR